MKSFSNIELDAYIEFDAFFGKNLSVYQPMTTPDSPNFRALCAALIKIVEEHCNPDEYALSDTVDTLRCARTALATPPPEPPVDGEVAELVDNCIVAYAEDPGIISSGRYMMIDDGKARAALLQQLSTPTPPPEPPTIGSVEDAARAIYSEAMTWAAANVPGGAIPPWAAGGNSTAQDVARRVARSLATPLPARPKPPTDEEIDEWADDPYDVTDEMLSEEEELGEYRCFTKKGLTRTIRAALERWGR